MAGSYNYVDGASLTELIFDVRRRFTARAPHDLGDGQRPNSVQAVALDTYVERSVDERLLVLRDLLERNPGLTLSRPPQAVFRHADAAPTYLTDLVCEVVREVLLRDPAIRAEDERRVTLARESLDDTEGLGGAGA